MVHLRLFWRYLKALYFILDKRNGLLMAQAIGFKVLITIVPLAVFSTGILGRVLRSERSFDAASRLGEQLLPGYFDQVSSFLVQLQESSGTFTWVGALGLLFSALLIVNTLETIVSTFIMGKDRERRPILRRSLFVFRIMAQVGLAFILTFVLSIGVQALNRSGLEFLSFVGMDNLWVEAGWRRAINFLGILVPFILTLSMFFQLYYFIPKPHPPLKSVMVGTMVAAVLWEAAKSTFTFYATNVDTFERYRGTAGESGVAALGDAFGILLAVVVWAYYTGIVLIVGAITVRLHEKHGWGRPHIHPPGDPSATA